MAKQEPTVTDIPEEVWKLPGHKIVEALNRVRSKGDLEDWTGSPPFHLNKEPATKA
jgi:hypothetical protein